MLPNKGPYLDENKLVRALENFHVKKKKKRAFKMPLISSINNRWSTCKLLSVLKCRVTRATKASLPIVGESFASRNALFERRKALCDL